MTDDPLPPIGQASPIDAAKTAETANGRQAAPTNFRQVHPALYKVWLLSGLITAILLALIVGFLERIWWSNIARWPLPDHSVTIAALIVFVVHAVVYSTWRYRAWRYAIRPHDVLLHYGVLWRTRSCIPRSRIQHVDIESGPIDRAFGMVKLTLYTAGARSAVGVIPGLLPEDAEAIRESLLGTGQVDG